MMESTRIFVRGLPPSIKDSDLRSHFDRFDSRDPAATALTDAHFIPHRRIGYVGYKTPETAAKAVKYFNKSFIRMSRIVAELARPVDESGKTRKRRKSPSPDLREDRLAKKRVEDGAEKQKNAKLESFVDGLRKPSKGQTWSNEDTVPQQADMQAVQSEDVNSDEDEYQQITRPSREHADPPLVSIIETDHRTERSGQPITDVLPPSRSDEDKGTVDQDGANPAEQLQASDADWLRSRTSRVLDLLEDEELDRLDSDKRKSEPSHLIEETTAPVTNASDMQQADAARENDVPKPEASEHTSSNRLLVRNLLYDVTDEELLARFSPYGAIDEIHICYDSKSGRSKGFAFIQFENAEDASEAKQSLSGKAFQGRNLQIETAEARRNLGIDDVALSKLPLKVQNQIKRKAGASTETFKWNSLYMSSDAIMSSVATRLGVKKSDVLDPTSTDAAIKQAHAETKTIQDTQSYFQKNGIDTDAFKQGKRGGNSDTAVLVKNFPFGTTAPEIRSLFEQHGPVKRLLIPPAATIAIVEMEQATHAKHAFGKLAYSKFKDTALLLEKAPRNLFKNDAPQDRVATEQSSTTLDVTIEEEFDQQETRVTSALFADKLPWSVTTETLRDLFQPLEGFLSARVMMKSDPRKPGQLLSRGFGFIEFRSKDEAKAALMAMNGYMFDNQQSLILRPSHKTTDVAEERRKEDTEKKLAGQGTKIIIKNLPFEVTKKDIRGLFSSYGQLRSVRVPKKFDSSSRGFAFADFVTAKEATNAMDALKNTHLLGRKLVLQFAAADAIDPEEEIQRMQEKVERQTDKIAAQKLAAGGRQKFRAHAGEEIEDSAF